MNVKTHKDHSYVRKNTGSVQTEGPRIAAVNHMLGEYQTDFVELVKRKSTVKDRTAGELYTINRFLCNKLNLVHFSFAILQNAKLKMMEIIDQFLEHLDCTGMQIAYTD